MLKKIITILLFVTLVTLHFSLVCASEINLPRTGQTSSYGTGDNGAIQAGQLWPAQRFTAANGAVTDNLTGLIWLQNANCQETVGGVANSSGSLTWANALAWSNALSSGYCGLTDGSTAGAWHLPTRLELESLVDESQYMPVLPIGHPFNAVKAYVYWSSSTSAGTTTSAWIVHMDDGVVNSIQKDNSIYVWPVRGGQ